MAELFECCLWYNADIPAEKEAAKHGIAETFLRTGVLHATRFGPITYEDLTVFDQRIPAPPSHMKGNLRCLYGSAKTNGELESVGGIVGDFTDEDLKMLRIVTRKAYLRAGGPVLTDEECDQLINEHGPEVIKEEIMG